MKNLIKYSKTNNNRNNRDNPSLVLGLLFFFWIIIVAINSTISADSESEFLIKLKGAFNIITWIGVIGIVIFILYLVFSVYMNRNKNQ